MTDELYAYRAAMNDFRLDPSSSALLIVDLQHGSADPTCGWVPAYTAIGHGAVMDHYYERVQQVVLPNVQRLQAAFRGAQAPVIFLVVGSVVGDFSDMPERFRRSHRYWTSRGVEPPYARYGTRAMQVIDAIAPVLGEPVIAKTGYSGFTGTPLERVLFNLKVRSLAICGVATESCVETTLRDAVDRGYDSVLVEDACASVTDESHRVGVDGMRLFGRIAATEEVVQELRAPALVA